jgi:hypothetical protein
MRSARVHRRHQQEARAPEGGLKASGAVPSAQVSTHGPEDREPRSG